MEEKDFLFSQMIHPDHQGVEEGGQGRRHLSVGFPISDTSLKILGIQI
jgi:hypothetical protein